MCFELIEGNYNNLKFSMADTASLLIRLSLTFICFVETGWPGPIFLHFNPEEARDHFYDKAYPAKHLTIPGKDPHLIEPNIKGLPSLFLVFVLSLN